MQQSSTFDTPRHAYDGVNYYCPRPFCAFRHTTFYHLMQHMRDEHAMEWDDVAKVWRKAWHSHAVSEAAEANPNLQK